MDIAALTVFLAVVRERSFSRAAAKMHRTQPAVSQAVRRLEREVGRELFDRSSKAPRLTDAGEVLHTYGERLLRIVEETEAAVRELRDLRRGRVLVGSNETAVHTLVPLIAQFHRENPGIVVDVRRVPARQIAVEVTQGSLDFGMLTFEPTEPGLKSLVVGDDELVLLVTPDHELADRKRVTMAEVSTQRVIAHNEPSPARDRVLRLFQEKNLPLNIVAALPSLDGIKRAVEMGVGVALLPRRCAVTEISTGRLVAAPVIGVSRRRSVSLIYRDGYQSHASAAFLAAVQNPARQDGVTPAAAPVAGR